mgnify:CR=1 FL=1
MIQALEQTVANPRVWFVVLCAAGYGVFVGAVPGLTATMAVSVIERSIITIVRSASLRYGKVSAPMLNTSRLWRAAIYALKSLRSARSPPVRSTLSITVSPARPWNAYACAVSSSEIAPVTVSP